MSRLKEAIDRFFSRGKPREIKATVNPQKEGISIVVDTTHKEGEKTIDLGCLGTFEHQPDGTVIFTSSDNPRVKEARVEKPRGRGIQSN
jgi:hypothetical protein